jgi:uncharacterized repeat protein (TIGR04076 family)
MHHKCKVTVLKRMVIQDLVDEYHKQSDEFEACKQFEDGQEIIIEHPFLMPENFCPWAWADIRKDILTIAVGSDLFWMKQRGTIITGCTDWFRPVIFKIERMD